MKELVDIAQYGNTGVLILVIFLVFKFQTSAFNKILNTFKDNAEKDREAIKVIFRAGREASNERSKSIVETQENTNKAIEKLTSTLDKHTKNSTSKGGA